MACSGFNIFNTQSYLNSNSELTDCTFFHLGTFIIKVNEEDKKPEVKHNFISNIIKKIKQKFRKQNQ